MADSDSQEWNTLIDTLLRHEIVAPSALEQTLAALPGGGIPRTERELLTALVESGALTPFQEECLLNQQIDLLDLGGYLVLDRLGAGAMGTVFRARHRLMNRLVAIKMMSPEMSRKPGFRRRFAREVQALALLHHPNIVMAFDAGEWKEQPFLVMEYVQGCDLATEVARHGPLSVFEAVDVIIQSAAGLAYAHQRGLVHRDVKPANLLLEASGRVKIADLGIARVNDGSETEHDQDLTQAGDFVGSASYASPEQALDATRVDARSDIYSLGCSLFYLLTGQAPYQAKSLVSLLLLHRDAAIPSLRKLRPDVPPELESILSRSLAKNPEVRQESMQEFAGELERLKTLSGGLSTFRPAEQAGVSEASACDATEAFVPTGTAHPMSAVSTIATASGEESASRYLAQRDWSKISVLLVEPSRIQARIACAYFETLGITRVRVVDSGEDALAVVATDSPDVIVCAMHLPDTTGAELARKIAARATAGRLGFVLSSSSAEEHPEMNESIADLPKALLLHKPYSIDKLAYSIDVALMS